MSSLSETLSEAFAAATDEATASEAADLVAAFADDHDESLDAGTVRERFDAAPHDGFTERFNWLIGDLAAASEDCTDSREYRLGGYGEFAADPDISA